MATELSTSYKTLRSATVNSASKCIFKLEAKISSTNLDTRTATVTFRTTLSSTYMFEATSAYSYINGTKGSSKHPDFGNSGGSMTLQSLNVVYTYADDGTFSGSATSKFVTSYGTDISQGSSAFTLPAIDPAVNVSIEPNLLSPANELMTISIQSSSEEYTNYVSASLVWNGETKPVNVTSSYEVITNKYYISYEDAKAAMNNTSGASAPMTILVQVKNGETIVVSKEFSARVSTGQMPLSLFDDRNGNIGVSIGERATSETSGKFIVSKDMTPEIPMGNLLKTIEVTKSITQATGYGSFTQTFNIPSGYSVVGIVGWNNADGSGGSYPIPVRNYVTEESSGGSKTGTVHITIRTTSSISGIIFKWYILLMYTGGVV